MAYYITGDCHANFEKLIWLARFNKKLGKEDVIIAFGSLAFLGDLTEIIRKHNGGNQ